MSDCFVVDVLSELHNIYELVNKVFKDTDKTTLWLNTPNPLLDYQAPYKMIFDKKSDKLVEFINSHLNILH